MAFDTALEWNSFANAFSRYFTSASIKVMSMTGEATIYFCGNIIV